MPDLVPTAFVLRVDKSGPAVWTALDGEHRAAFEAEFRSVLVEVAETFEVDRPPQRPQARRLRGCFRGTGRVGHDRGGHGRGRRGSEAGNRPTGSAIAVTGHSLDTDVISAVLKPAPPLHLIRRLMVTPAECQFTTAITVGELIYGAARRRNARLSERVQQLIHDAGVVLPFDEVASFTAPSKPTRRNLDPTPHVVWLQGAVAREACLIARAAVHHAHRRRPGRRRGSAHDRTSWPYAQVVDDDVLVIETS